MDTPHSTLRALANAAQRHRRIKWTFLTVASLLVVLLAANYAMGDVIRSKIASVAQHRLHTYVNASIGGAPALEDAITKHIPSVRIDAPDASICSLSGVNISANLNDLSKQHSQISVSSSDAQVTIDASALTSAIARKLPSATVRPDPADDTIDLNAGPGGVVGIDIRPTLQNQTLSFKVAGLTILGRAAPSSITSRLQQRVHFTRTLKKAPLNLTPKSVSVTENGINVALSGGAWRGATSGSYRPVCQTQA